MHRLVLVVLLIAILIFGTITFKGIEVKAQNSDDYSLALEGFAWDHTSLQVLVITPDNTSWWNSAFLNASLRAIGQWNEAITNFAANYSDFSYVSNVALQATVSDSMQPGFDIYLNWTDTSLSSMTDEVGLSEVLSDASAIINCTVVLAVQTNHGQPLNEVDMQNVALHELGHSLGLGHSNYTGDLMYAMYSLQGSPVEVSTLDMYGVAALFAWETQPGFYPVDAWFNESSVNSPFDIAYLYIPVSPLNAAPQTLATNPIIQQLTLMWELLLHPEIFAVVVGFLVVCIILGILSRRRHFITKAEP